MNKKEISLVVLAFVIVGAMIGGAVLLNKPKQLEPMPIHGFTGTITEVKENSIVVKAVINKEERVIELVVTPQTNLKKTTMVITEEQIKSEEPYTPKSEVSVGQISDFVVNDVVVVRTKDNVLKTNQTEAVDISYSTFKFPTNEIQ